MKTTRRQFVKANVVGGLAAALPLAALGAAAPGAGRSLAEAEKQLILRALKECDGNRTGAARKLGLSRRTLHRKLHLYQLEGV